MALLLVVQASWLTSCNDDMAAENYYTFTGEMMSDYLNNREDFSLFRRIVERSGNMSLLSARGTSTFFPATNAGVEAFLAEMGYGSVEDIPEVYCDTLVKASFIEDRVLYTYNMEAVQQIDNALELPLIITTSDTLVDADGVPLSVVNGRARIINSMKNDSVDNGVVHPVDQVIVPNTTIGSTFLEQNSADFKIYFEALRRTNLAKAWFASSFCILSISSMAPPVSCSSSSQNTRRLYTSFQSSADMESFICMLILPNCWRYPLCVISSTISCLCMFFFSASSIWLGLTGFMR